MRLQISFTIKTFENTGEVFLFVTKFMKNRMTAIFSYVSYPDNDWIDSYEEVVKALSSENDNAFTVHDGEQVNALMYGNEANSFSFLREPNFEIELITIEFVDESLIDINNFLKECALLKFNTAQRFEFSKSMWQSERFPSNFTALNKSCDDKELISHPIWTKRFGLIINLRKNPGRDIITYNMHLMAAPEMWFGPGSWAYFEMENILNCTQVLEAREVLPSVVYVKLFDPEVDDYETPQILTMQKSFRVCSKMDEVEDLLNSKLSFPIGY